MEPERGGRRAPPVALGLLLLVLAGLSGLLGADRVRRSRDPRAEAQSAVERSFERGAHDAGVRATLRALREGVGHRPMDSRTRAVYAALLLALSGSTADLAAPVFHARVAARFAPVTVPVLRTTAQVLVRAGRTDDALEQIRGMFLYAPGAAARLLLRVEPWLAEGEVSSALPDRPEAWLAWSRRLRQEGRRDDGERWLERAHRRWPAHVDLTVDVAADLVRRGAWEALERLLPADRALPAEPRAARLHVYRALLRARRADAAGARADVSRALDLDGSDPSILLLAGDVYRELRLDDDARAQWNRLLFTLAADAVSTRRAALRRLARLEEDRGAAGTALRHWRAVLELDPRNDEARRRVAALTGGTP